MLFMEAQVVPLQQHKLRPQTKTLAASARGSWHAALGLQVALKF